MNRPMIGFGTVRHTRLRPVLHHFAYPTFFLLLPMRSLRQDTALAAPLAVNRTAALSFHDRDHGDGRVDALEWLDALLAGEGIVDADGEAWLHCFPRVLGHTFKPVSFWYCHRADGTLRAQVFPDVAPAFARWGTKGLTISIFSSGSVLAQQLLFAHTEAGDLTSFISNYFDTSVGKKGDAESYRRIADTIGLAPSELLFVSDITTELAAANEAGMKTLLSIRPGNQPQHHAEQYRTIESFDEL